MTFASILAYCGALFIAAAIPGPGMTAIVARALGSGFRETLFMGLGLILGDLIYLTAVILGLSLLAETFTGLFFAIKIAGALYLGYIAWKLWTAGLIGQDVQARKSTGAANAFLSGLFVTLGNPKTMLFYVALAPSLVPIDQIGPADYLILVCITFTVLLLVLIPYMLAAARARALLKTPAALRILNRSAAGILGTTAAYIALRPN